ncbi:MAG TPA: ATP-binding cassette domain-containing protein [Dinghuibacter sp.]|uniref:ABC transporter ATP-binding protein n=1 Tax=Dinghuibacter sp. TaxID=2024697 RepID=UPI002CDFC314|nr:ATP-binding cassette domain-containing protein [Dinghuibacter sp.]HTJ14705.1 ATP-binding cassette domain-containing protein [Dinghuibacter sp.]
MLLSFSNVRLSYAGASVLDIPSFALPDGFYEVRGPNGSGKTTLLKAIAGLLPVTGAPRVSTGPGAITLSGLDSVRDRVAYRRGCGFAEAKPLYPEFLTGAELYAFYVKTKGGEGPYAPALRSALGLDAFIGRKTGAYSSGMLKKLSLVLAWIGNPLLVLLDEPLVTLDAAAVAVVEDWLRSSPVSLIVTSHQPWALNPAPIYLREKQLYV